jgi:uncharacterized protein (DUF427 family)
VVLVESTSARVLFETGLPPRWYLSKPHLRMDLLMPTGTVNHCPTRARPGTGPSARGDHVAEDLAWFYRTPLNERVDLFIDDPSSSGRSPRPASEGRPR